MSIDNEHSILPDYTSDRSGLVTIQDVNWRSSQTVIASDILNNEGQEERTASQLVNRRKKRLKVSTNSTKLHKPFSAHSMERPLKKKAKMNDSSNLYSGDLQNNSETSVNTSCKPSYSHNKSENIWNLLKRVQTDWETMCMDFRLIYTHKELFMPEQLKKYEKGYYDAFFKDLAEYIEEHRPRTEAEHKKQVDKSEYIRKYTLGDLYMKKDLSVLIIKTCIEINEHRYDFLSLIDKIKTMFKIPEIFIDLTFIPKHIFQNILLEVKKSKDKLSPLQVTLLEYLYKILHPEEPQSKENTSICNKHLDIFDNTIEGSNRAPSKYNLEELYKEMYKGMAAFYKHALYSYKDENTGERIEIMSKDVIVDQLCIKCEAIVDKKATVRGAPYRIISNSLKYSPMSHHWNISSKIAIHYHIQFVDNSLHTLKRVCLPIFRFIYDATPSYFHTISDIIKYLERIYNIEEKGKIYPLVTEENGSTWRILKDKEKKQTINYLKKKEEALCSILLRKRRSRK